MYAEIVVCESMERKVPRWDTRRASQQARGVLEQKLNTSNVA